MTLSFDQKRQLGLSLTVLAVVTWTFADVINPNRLRPWIIFGGFVMIFVGAFMSFLSYKGEKKAQLPR